jgi:hypothetical protein
VLAWEARRAPTPAQWSEAAGAVRAQKQARDLVVFAPDWVDPLGRQAFGDLISLEDATRVPGSLAGYRRLFEVAIRGKRAPEARGRKDEWRASFGPIVVRRYALPASELVSDLAAALPRAKVTLERGGRSVPCSSWDGRRWRCNNSVWNSVGAGIYEVGYRGLRCVWAHPVDRAVKRIEVDDFEVGDRLVGGMGLADNWARMVNDHGAEVVGSIDGREVGRVIAGPDDGVVAFAWKTPGPGKRRLRLEVRGRGTAFKRQVCLALQGLRTEQRP